MTTPYKATLEKRRILHRLFLSVFWLILAACTAGNPTRDTNLSIPMPVTASVTPASTIPVATTTTTNGWLVLLQQQPYPYTTPLPPDHPTTLDGLYTKEEPVSGTPVPCRRCPDYLSEDGIWKLSLQRGIYHIFHPLTGWHTLGSFAVEGNRLYLFNDPACHLVVGIYTWQLDTTGLNLTVVDDPCQVGRRADTFSDLTWRACQPPNTEAAVTGHWPHPAGCDWPLE